ncbi:hypothetical protein [Phaeodactylibacter sp.]|jgi:hypothetical protein|uniref:hypothetical protein n=1 Tax=Phaeodactylibacter sp. TaxID=1940289 RepID=UPI0025DC39B0|nr:hypothetical protein [Phaeodactylibacter sp.]MCI4649136.1 hypothetical protein [Phaeodactylibacter sp.]MCI5091298.1 hypothetical protein [Phaeodactylibacter sp.]
MIGMLQVVIGLIFVLLLLSLLATTMMELVASAFSLRGRNLEKALRNMLASTEVDDQLVAAFKDNALYKQLSYKYGKKRYSPSYLSDRSFQSILMETILNGEGFDRIEERLDTLPDADLKNVLKQFLRESEHDVEAFKGKVRTWYNDVMDRASGWYKRYTQKILVGMGFFIAVVFNADTLAIYERLESDPETLQQVLTLAEDYVNGKDGLEIAPPQMSPEFDASLRKLEFMINDQIESVKSPLGLGWKNVDWSEVTWYDVVLKLLGWTVTALAVSLGAPFWFDLLRKLVNIRSSGNKPE